MYHNFCQLAPIATASCSHGCTLLDSLGEPDFPQEKVTALNLLLSGEKQIIFRMPSLSLSLLVPYVPSTCQYKYFMMTFHIPIHVHHRAFFRGGSIKSSDLCTSPPHHKFLASYHFASFGLKKSRFLTLHFPNFWELDRASHFP